MTDYRTITNRGKRPWSREVEAGDYLTPDQGDAIDETRLRDYGLMLIPLYSYGFVVAPIVVSELGALQCSEN